MGTTGGREGNETSRGKSANPERTLASNIFALCTQFWRRSKSWPTQPNRMGVPCLRSPGGDLLSLNLLIRLGTHLSLSFIRKSFLLYALPPLNKLLLPNPHTYSVFAKIYCKRNAYQTTLSGRRAIVYHSAPDNPRQSHEYARIKTHNGRRKAQPFA
jgi:hypothetical protein